MPDRGAAGPGIRAPQPAVQLAAGDWRSGSIGLGLWAVTAAVSGLGSNVLAFALSWEASAYGAAAASLVATLGVLPRVLLMLLGGAAADQFGIRRVMICCDAAMIGVLGVTLLRLMSGPADLPVIIAVTVAAGIVSAFHLPAAGGFVRLFVPPDRLPRTMARVGGLQQISRMIGPPLGAVLVIMISLPGVALVDLLSYAAVLAVLIMVRPPIRLAAAAGNPTDRAIAVTAIAARLSDGVRRAVRTDGMVGSLLAVSLVAGGVLPMLYLCLPLAVRERGWGVAAAGMIESCWIIGGLIVTAVIATRGAHHRSGPMIIGGALLAAVGGLGIALAPTVPVAAAGSVAMGIGTAIFTGHLSPLFLAWTPPELTARFQSLYGIVQALPMVIMNLAYGWLAATFGVTSALIAAASMTGAASVVAAASRRVRTATISSAVATPT